MTMYYNTASYVDFIRHYFLQLAIINTDKTTIRINNFNIIIPYKDLKILIVHVEKVLVNFMISY